MVAKFCPLDCRSEFSLHVSTDTSALLGVDIVTGTAISFFGEASAPQSR
jgi:hypothetical protein